MDRCRDPFVHCHSALGATVIDLHKISCTPPSTAEIVHFPATAAIGHNAGPPLTRPEPHIGKIQAIDAVLHDKRYSQTEALTVIGLIVRSDANYANAFPGAQTLAIYAKV